MLNWRYSGNIDRDRPEAACGQTKRGAFRIFHNSGHDSAPPLNIFLLSQMDTKMVGWSGEIACEGGPVLVVNLDDFGFWRGVEPFDSSRATELHYWSPFTPELPEHWHPNGPTGHQYLASANPSLAREELMALLLNLWPGTTVDRSGSTWRASRPDGRTLNAALSPDSEYDSATRTLGSDGIHHFGDGTAGYLWSVAPGMVRIDVDEKRDFLLLSQVEYADDEHGAQEAYDHALGAAWFEAAPTKQYRVTLGPVVVTWAPNSACDLTGPIDHADAEPSRSGVLLDMATAGSGALLWLKPGLYESSLQYREEDSWAISWCRLQRIDEKHECSSKNGARLDLRQ